MRSMLGVLVLAVCAGVLLSSAAEQSPYYAVVSVGCGGIVDDGVGRVVYHLQAVGVDRVETDRVFKVFEGEDTNRCLKAILERDVELATRVRRLSSSAPGERSLIHRDVTRAWDGFAVGEALEEVARSGARGPKVAALLKRCVDLPNYATTVLPPAHLPVPLPVEAIQ